MNEINIQTLKQQGWVGLHFKAIEFIQKNFEPNDEYFCSNDGILELLKKSNIEVFNRQTISMALKKTCKSSVKNINGVSKRGYFVKFIG